MPKMSDWTGGLLPHETAARAPTGEVSRGLGDPPLAEGSAADDPEVIRYSKGELVEDDNDSHLSDVSRLASDVAWKSGPIAGLHLKK